MFESNFEWMINFTVNSTGFENKTINVHSGFKSLINRATASIEEAIFKLFNKQKIKELFVFQKTKWIFLGHSRGGALATLLHSQCVSTYQNFILKALHKEEDAIDEKNKKIDFSQSAINNSF